jgi:hypothetical protein
MSLKDQILNILEKSRTEELEFISSLTDAERAFEGTFEKWSAKDAVAHVNYWQAERATRTEAWIAGDELESLPGYEQANLESYRRFAGLSWDEIEAFAQQAHDKIRNTIQGLSDDVFTGPSEASTDRKMWEDLVGTFFTHKLMHYTDFYHQRGEHNVVSRIWGEWGDLVSPLDDSPNWQGGVYYNAACSLALAGDQSGALEKLRTGLELRPGLRAWSRSDSDLASLHDLPEYKELFAADFWWKALDAGPQAEALADHLLRTLSMLRIAIDICPEDEWLQGDRPSQRPVGLALHVTQSILYYSASKPGEQLEDELTQISWQEGNVEKLPSQKELLRFLNEVEKRMANLIATADLTAEEELFPWAGKTILSRIMFITRHAQHHLADMISEINRRTGSSEDIFQ